eukprot:2358340-Rhodomonas_salina.1
MEHRHTPHPPHTVSEPQHHGVRVRVRVRANSQLSPAAPDKPNSQTHKPDQSASCGENPCGLRGIQAVGCMQNRNISRFDAVGCMQNRNISRFDAATRTSTCEQRARSPRGDDQQRRLELGQAGGVPSAQGEDSRAGSRGTANGHVALQTHRPQPPCGTKHKKPHPGCILN